MAQNNEQPPRKHSRGRQKVAMVKMTNESNLQVTFSKRRTGLFKKASELCTLCGAEMTLVVFSPGKKVFSFGHPSVEAVLDRYVGISGDIAASSANAATMQLVEAHRSVNLRDLNTQLAQIMTHADTEKKRGEQMIRQRREAMDAHHWWEGPIDKMDDEWQLRQLKRALEELKRAVLVQTDRNVIETAAANARASSPQFYGNQGGAGGGGGGSGRNSGGQGDLFTNNMNNIGSTSSYNNNNNNNNNLGYGRGFY